MSRLTRIAAILAWAAALGSCQGIGAPRLAEPIVERQGAATTCNAKSVTAVATVVYTYDLAGRQTRDRDARLLYDPWNQLKEVQLNTTTSPKYNDGRTVVAEKHTYGFDGSRTSTTTNPGAANAAVRVQITPNDVIHDGKREHYVRLGSRIVARLAMTATGTLMAAPPPQSRSDQEQPSAGKSRFAQLGASGSALAGLAMLALSLAAAAAALRRRRRWAPALAGMVGLVAASCEMLGGDLTGGFSTLLLAETTYFHTSLGAGPSLITRQDGSILEERRFEPFGVPIDAFRSGRAGSAPVDLVTDPQSIVGKQADATNGFTDHGARWLASQSARWLTPDPESLRVDPKHLQRFWDLNPYTYVGNNPSLFWDPDGFVKSLFFIGNPTRANNDMPGTGPNGRPKPFRLTDDKDHSNKEAYLKAVREDLAAKTNSKVDEVTVEFVENNEQLQARAAAHAGGDFELTGYVGHAFTNLSSLAPVSSATADNVEITAANMDQAIKKTGAKIKDVKIYGCSTRTDKNHFAFQLKKLEGKDVKVEASREKVGMRVDEPKKDQYKVTIQSNLEDVSWSDAVLDDKGYPVE